MTKILQSSVPPVTTGHALSARVTSASARPPNNRGFAFPFRKIFLFAGARLGPLPSEDKGDVVAAAAKQ